MTHTSVTPKGHRGTQALTRLLWRARWRLLRRATQVGIWAVFFGTLHWGWTLFGQPVARGTLTSSTVVGAVPLADPFAALQLWLANHVLEPEILLGAALVVGVYSLLGGRVFCSWVCPINAVTDLAAWLQRRFGIRPALRGSRSLRYGVLGLALGLSLFTGVAAFEWISPVGMVHRAVLFASVSALTVAGAILVFDLFVMRHGWCGHVCPLGAFYGIVGRGAQVRVGFEADRCTRCGLCVQSCPEPQVLNLNQAAVRGFVSSGECSNCGTCIEVCPEGSLSFGLRRLQVRSGAPTKTHSECRK